MRILILLPLVALAMLLNLSSALAQSMAIDDQASTNIIRVACIGDSITFGIGLEDIHRHSYPARLGRMLGPRWAVANLGVPAVTCLGKGDIPLGQQGAIPAAMQLDPAVVVIMLGTNDAKTNNWIHAEDFVRDCSDLVRTFKDKWNQPQVWLCTPPPLYTPPGSIATDATLASGVIPKIKAAAEQTGVSVIDIHTVLTGKPELFPDGIHPNNEGTLLIAEHVYRAITGRVPPARE